MTTATPISHQFVLNICDLLISLSPTLVPAEHLPIRTSTFSSSSTSSKMASPDLKKIFSKVDDNKKKFIDVLAESVEIKSVSAWPQSRDEVVRMMHWAGDRLKALGATVEYADIGQQTLPDGQKLKLPPVLLGHLGEDPKKKTLLLYGHLDVQPALKEDGWDYEPFVVSYILHFLSDTPHHFCHHFPISVDGGQGQAVREGFDGRQGSRHRLDPRHRVLPGLRGGHPAQHQVLL